MAKDLRGGWIRSHNYGATQVVLLGAFMQAVASLKVRTIAFASAGNTAATPRAINATSKAYSIRSCPSSSFHNLVKMVFISLYLSYGLAQSSRMAEDLCGVIRGYEARHLAYSISSATPHLRRSLS
jgi:hypothetical protein